MTRYDTKADRIEHVGFLLCALFIGLLAGWVGGTWAAIRNLNECIEPDFLHAVQAAD